MRLAFKPEYTFWFWRQSWENLQAPQAMLGENLAWLGNIYDQNIHNFGAYPFLCWQFTHFVLSEMGKNMPIVSNPTLKTPKMSVMWRSVYDTNQQLMYFCRIFLRFCFLGNFLTINLCLGNVFSQLCLEVTPPKWPKHFQTTNSYSTYKTWATKRFGFDPTLFEVPTISAKT